MSGIDLDILHFFNRTLASPALDAIMSALTSVWWWMPVYVIAGVYLIYKYRINGVILLGCAIVIVTFADQLTNALIKPLVDRARPCAMIDGVRAVEWIRLPIGERQGPSFPSSHALNNAAVALFFGLVFQSRKLLSILLVAALSIGVSRMYLGLHYPSDIAGGLMIGAVIGYAFALLYKRFLPKARHVV